MAAEQGKQLSDEARRGYDRMLERVEARLAESEVRTWETLRQEIDEAVEFEQELARLTREEIDLLAAYLRRDLSHLVEFVSQRGATFRDWLRIDMDLVEARLLDLLFGIADKTQLDRIELDQKLDHDPGKYMAGEIATAGVLRCLSCGHMLCLTETSHLEACHHCRSHYFERITARWPHETEADDAEA